MAAQESSLDEPLLPGKDEPGSLQEDGGNDIHHRLVFAIAAGFGSTRGPPLFAPSVPVRTPSLLPGSSLVRV